MRRAVRIVFDLRHLSGNAGLITLKVNDPVKSLMATAATTDSDSAVAITA